MNEIESFMYGTGSVCCKLQAVNEIKALLPTLIHRCVGKFYCHKYGLRENHMLGDMVSNS